jgi:hypothetical protein
MLLGHGGVVWILVLSVAPLVLVGSGSLPPTSAPRSGVYGRQAYAPLPGMEGKARGGDGWGPGSTQYPQQGLDPTASRAGDQARPPRLPDKVGHIGKVTKVQDVEGKKYAVVDREIYVPLSKAECWRPEGTELIEGDWVRLDAYRSAGGKANPWTCSRFMKVAPPPGANRGPMDNGPQIPQLHQPQEAGNWDRSGGDHAQWNQAPDASQWHGGEDQQQQMYQPQTKQAPRYGAPGSAPGQMNPAKTQSLRGSYPPPQQQHDGAHAQGGGTYQKQYTSNGAPGWPPSNENSFDSLRRGDRPDMTQTHNPASEAPPPYGDAYAQT